MASHRGFLPASKEIVLEIQLNKLIHDFLFSGVDGSNTSSLRHGNAEVQKEAARNVEMSRLRNVQKQPWKVEENPSEKMDNPSPPLLQNSNLTENAGSLESTIGAKGASNAVPGTDDARSPGSCISNAVNECKDVILDHNTDRCPGTPPLAEDVRLDIPEQTSNPCVADISQHTNKVKVFRLSKAHSIAGSLLCFAMERQGENKEKEKKGRVTGGSIKLTRIGSLPCHSQLHTESKHTCKKPPRPPRSPLEKNSHTVLSGHASSDAILVLRGTSRRARLERRKRHTGSSSSNASVWALIFTLFFALAMLGEGFWSLNSPLTEIDSSVGTTTANSNIKTTHEISSVERTLENGIYVSSQSEKEMQMREFWMSKGLDPT